MATNSHQFLELYHAAFLGAGVINPSNLRLADRELDHIVRDSGTGEAFRDGWYRIGDAGHLDDEGYLYLVDRVKDMFVTGGWKDHDRDVG